VGNFVEQARLVTRCDWTLAWLLPMARGETARPGFSRSSQARKNTGSVALYYPFWGAVVIMGLLFHGDAAR
jgi:hypothetical protein